MSQVHWHGGAVTPAGRIARTRSLVWADGSTQVIDRPHEKDDAPISAILNLSAGFANVFGNGCVFPSCTRVVLGGGLRPKKCVSL